MATSGNESPSWMQVALRLGIFTLRDRASRRKLMFYISLGTLLQLGLGMLLMGWLTKSIFLFVVYWGFCGFLVCLMLLMAVYDMLAVRQEQLRELHRIREQVFGDENPPTVTDANDPRDSGEA